MILTTGAPRPTSPELNRPAARRSATQSMMKGIVLFLSGSCALSTTMAAGPTHAATPRSDQIPATGTLNNSHVLSLIDRVLAFKPRDEFSAPPDLSKYYNRKFSLLVSIRKCEGGDFSNPSINLPCWRYYVESGKLYLSVPIVSSSTRSTASPDDYVSADGFYIKGTQAKTGAYVGMNAFNAKRIVEVYKYVEYGVGVINKGEGWADRSDANNLPSGNDYNIGYSKYISMQPEAARAIVSHLTFVIEGYLVGAPSGGAVNCDAKFQSATILDPEERSGLLCLLSSRIQRIAFVDDRTDTPVAEWTQQ
jgi:hypothetical protein